MTFRPNVYINKYIWMKRWNVYLQVHAGASLRMEKSRCDTRNHKISAYPVLVLHLSTQQDEIKPRNMLGFGRSRPLLRITQFSPLSVYISDKQIGEGNYCFHGSTADKLTGWTDYTECLKLFDRLFSAGVWIYWNSIEWKSLFFIFCVNFPPESSDLPSPIFIVFLFSGTPNSQVGKIEFPIVRFRTRFARLGLECLECSNACSQRSNARKSEAR